MVALTVGLTVVKVGTNNENNKDYCWQRMGLTQTKTGTNSGFEQSEDLEFQARQRPKVLVYNMTQLIH